MYHASAAFIQHTMVALYSDLDITVRSLKDNSQKERSRDLEMCIIVSAKQRVTDKLAEWDV